MVTIYLCPLGQKPTEELVKTLAKPYFPGAVPQVLRQQRGKPYFAGESGVHFSVSHSGEYVAVAFAESPVGIDLQQHRSHGDAKARHQKLASRYFHPREQEYVAEDLWEGFFRVWTAKESFVKRTGRGIDHHHAEICILPQGESWQDENGFFRQTTFSGYTLTLSTESPTDWIIQTV